MDFRSNAEWWHRLIGPLLEADEVELSLGVSGQELRQLIAERKLLALPWQGRLVFPAFQFGYDGQPFDVLPKILTAFGDTSPFQIAAWFQTSQPFLEDVPPVRWIELQLEEEQLVSAARKKAELIREQNRQPQAY